MPPAKKNEPITLDALPPGSVVELQGKKYPTHSGLLALAHAHGMTSMATDVLSYADGEAVVKATVEGSRGTYTGHGDASPANVNRNIASAVLRMAETRSQNRAMRAYLGLGATTLEEMPPDAIQGRSNQRQRPAHTQQPKRAPEPPRERPGPKARLGSRPCPECGSKTWDNREYRKWLRANPEQKPIPAMACNEWKTCKWTAWDTASAEAFLSGTDGFNDGL